MKPGVPPRERAKRILMLKTFYPHWGKNTAFNSFGDFFDPRRFKIEMKNVTMGEDEFPFRFMRKYIQRKIRSRAVQEYKLNDFMAEFSLFRQSLFVGADVVHFLDAEHSLMFLPELFRKFRHIRAFPPVIAMVHQPPEILKKIVNMEILRQVRRVLTVSPHQEEFLRQWLPTDQVSTILLGVNTRHFKPSGAAKPEQPFKCLSGGVWLRDYPAIFATAEKLREFPDIEFHIVAPSKLKAGAAGNIIFHENIPDEQLMELYQSCHALFLPFKDATANTFLLEGAACGLPVISSNIPGVRAYFPGAEAIRIDGNHPDDFAEAILQLKKNPSFLADMSRKAVARAGELSWENIIKQYEVLYGNIL